jgi:hypothetical protein
LWLLTAEFWYNSCFHSSLGKTPFEALYGRAPHLLGVDPPMAAGDNLDQWLTDRANADKAASDLGTAKDEKAG